MLYNTSMASRFRYAFSSTPALRIAWLNMLYVWSTITPVLPKT